MEMINKETNNTKEKRNYEANNINKELKDMIEKRFKKYNAKVFSLGAEAAILKNEDKGIVIKYRFEKVYRIKEIDEKLRRDRTKREIRVLEKLKGVIPVPKILETGEYHIIMQYIPGTKLSNLTIIEKWMIEKIAKCIVKIHENNIIHGDLTTSNMLLYNNEIYFIDFGLSFFSNKIEDFAVELHLLREALESKHYNQYPEIFNIIIKTYEKHFSLGKKVIERLAIVEKRGRYKQKQ